MGIQLNVAQELFLVVFSILYGVMLQSLSRYQPFPLGRTLKGFMKRDRKSKETEFKCDGDCQEIPSPEESEKNEWLIRMWRRRTVLSIIVLNCGPLIYFGLVLGLLSIIPGDSFLLILDFSSINGSLVMLLTTSFVFMSAMAVFGFYRIYIAIGTWRWKTLFCDIAMKLERTGTSFDSKAHFLWGIFYVFWVLPLMLLVFCPSWWLLWGIGTTGVFIVFLIWLIN